MASIQKRIRSGKTDYRVSWRERGTQKTKSFARFADAKAFAGLMEANERRHVGDPQRQKTGEFLDRWLTGLRERGEHSPVTLDSYAFCIKRVLPAIGDLPLGRLGTADIDAAYASLRARGIAASTIGLVHCALHSAFEQARKWKLVSENPVSDASPPRRVQSRSRAFTVEEVGRLLAAAESDPELHAIAATLFITGLRRSELLAMAWDAVDLDAATITVKRTVLAVVEDGHTRALLRDETKTAAAKRTIAIPASLVALLTAQRTRILEKRLLWGPGYLTEPFLVFPAPGGEPVHPLALTRRLARLMKVAGITGAQPAHAWRHTAATLLVDGGQNIKTVQTRMGHTNASITLRLYVHPVTERDRDAADHLGALIEARPPKAVG